MPVQQSLATRPSRSFSVALIGAESGDQVTLKRILDITRYRTRRYNLVTLATDTQPEDAIARVEGVDIFIVNINSPRAIMLWSRMANKLQGRASKPVIRITKEKHSTAQPELVITWPINPGKVVSVLDNYTINHLDFIPELEIGSETAISETTLQKVAYISSQRQAQRQALPKSRTIRALVADDSLPVRRQLKMEFDMLGSALTLVEDGEAAVDAARTEPYDIIFLDVVMPGLDGYAACKQIRRRSANRETPVILLTSKSSSFDKLKGMLAGCDTYLTKPINHNDFNEITQKHLNEDGETQWPPAK